MHSHFGDYQQGNEVMIAQQIYSSTGDPENLCPEVVPDISAWPLFPGTYVVGNRRLDRYLIVSASKLPLVRELIACFDGRHSITSMAESFARKGRRVDVMTLYQRLLEAGLVVGSEPTE